MINWKNIKAITKREVSEFLNAPASYIVLVVFLILWQFLFFRNAFLVGEASLRSLFDLLPWLMLVLVPAITMGAIARERSEGTMEFTLTHPVKELEFLLGKFLGSLFFVFVALLSTVFVAVSFSFFGDFDWGVYAAQFLGSVFFSAAFISLGIFVSSLFTSQIPALLVTAGSGFILILIGSEFFALSLPLALSPILERLSLLSHTYSVVRGVLDVRDLWYFLSFIAVFISLAYLRLIAIKYGNKKSIYRNLARGVFLFVGVVVLTNIVGDRIPGRIDFTENRVYTLSKSTKSTLGSLDDLVTVNLYVSSKLPIQYSSLLRDVKSVLSDYELSSRGKLVVNQIDPSSSPEKEEEAVSQGIQQVQFNVVGKEEFQVKKGFFGLTVSYGGEQEIIPFVESTSDLEYQLTSFIRKLSVEEKKSVAFLQGHQEKDPRTDYAAWKGELENQFDVSIYTIAPEDTEINESVDVLVVASPKEKFSVENLAVIKEYLEAGRPALFLIDMYSVEVSSLNGTLVTTNISELLSEYGVNVNGDVVYDLSSNETIRFNNGFVSYFLPYPFWVRTQVKDTTQVTSQVKGVVFPWPSSLYLDKATAKEKGIEAMELLVSSPNSFNQSGTISLSPEQKFSDKELETQTLAVSLQSEETGMRVVIAGESDFMNDEHVTNSPQNLSFGMSAISWLGLEDSMTDIRIKASPFGRLSFKNQTESSVVKYANLGLVGGVPILFAVFRLTKRRNMKDRKYV
jgi:ABC-type transport system involved in multi-copper enzyme maturation permease subunit/ABC-type uncharacterized transport system involved in gliding motility auxiliary subunit